MMKLVIFLMGNIIQILLTRGEGDSKGHFRDDVLYERSSSCRPDIEVINMPHNYFHLLTTTAELGAKHKI